MLKQHFARWSQHFEADRVVYWSHLSRLNNLMVVMNISMFFLTGLVAKGYYYTFFSLGCLAVVGVGMLVPTALIHRLWYYGIFLAMEIVSLYFLATSVVYWVRNGSG